MKRTLVIIAMLAVLVLSACSGPAAAPDTTEQPADVNDAPAEEVIDVGEEQDTQDLDIEFDPSEYDY